jgi:hypothetical protein
MDKRKLGALVEVIWVIEDAEIGFLPLGDTGRHILIYFLSANVLLEMLGHSIVSQHFMEPEGSIPNSQELPTCSYPEDQSSPHHAILSLQDPS